MTLCCAGGEESDSLSLSPPNRSEFWSSCTKMGVRIDILVSYTVILTHLFHNCTLIVLDFYHFVPDHTAPSLACLVTLLTLALHL